MSGITSSPNNVSLLPGIYTISNSGHSIYTFLQLDGTCTRGRARILPVYFFMRRIFSRRILGGSTANVRYVLRTIFEEQEIMEGRCEGQIFPKMEKKCHPVILRASRISRD